MKIVHACAGWQANNGAAVIARLIAGEQKERGDQIFLRTWAGIGMLRAADEVWIHCGWMPCLWWAALWARRAIWVPEACYDPVRLAYHGWKKRLVGPVERWALRRCSRIVATCKVEKAWIESYLGSDCPTVEVTNIKRFFRVGEGAEKGLPGLPRHILYLGRRHPLKGVEFLERAVQEINDEAGMANDERRSVELRIVSDHFGEELERDWAWCDTLVLPTLSDNLGLVVAEALERGKRVVVTDGAPAWGEGELFDCSDCSGCSIGYGGRLVYLKGYRDGTDAKRVKLLADALKRIMD